MTRLMWKAARFVPAVFVLSTLAASAQTTVTISGSGSGVFEDPKVAGGAVGWATCTLNRFARQIDCSARVYNILDLTAGHMHIGGAGIAGPVILPIPNLPLRISNDFSHTWTWKDADLAPRDNQGIHTLEDVFDACASGNCYLNFHTTLNPGGEMRINMCPESRASNTYTGVDVCHPDK